MTQRISSIIAIVALSLTGCDQVDSLKRDVGIGVGAAEGVVITVGGPRPVTMRASLEDQGNVAVLTRVSLNGEHEIWRSETGDTITLREGVVVGTRSLTPDLFSVEATLPSQWRAAPRPATTDRIHRYVDGDLQEFIRGYACLISEDVPETFDLPDGRLQTLRTDEECFNATQSFTNSYWLDGAGRLVLSRQWIGPELGYIRLNHHLP